MVAHILELHLRYRGNTALLPMIYVGVWELGMVDVLRAIGRLLRMDFLGGCRGVRHPETHERPLGQRRNLGVEGTRNDGPRPESVESRHASYHESNGTFDDPDISTLLAR